MNRKHQRATIRPCLETLEDRACPSCVVELLGTTLNITGDAGNNQITVSYFAPGDLSVDCDGALYQFSEPVDGLLVRSGNGNDLVTVEFLAGFFGIEANLSGNWTVDLGQGDDFGGVFGIGDVDGPMNIAVLGGNGVDEVSANLSVFIAADVAVALDGGNGNDSLFHALGVEGSGRVTAAVFGGNGDDFIFDLGQFTRVQDRLDARIDGGNGSDVVTSTLGMTFAFGPNTPDPIAGVVVAGGGELNYVVTGGKGDDSVRVDYLGRINGRLNLAVDGGNGNDEVVANLDVNVASIGVFSADVRGGNGDDQMDVLMRYFESEFVEIPEIFPGFLFEVFAGYTDTPAPLGLLSVTANGGNGFDSCLYSAQVSVFGIEDDQPI